MDDMRHTYSDALYKKRVFIIGPTPLPLGGVAVHIERVGKKLRSQQNIVWHHSSCVEYRYRWLYMYLVALFFRLLWCRPDFVHFHTLYLSNGLSELKLLVWLRVFLNYRLVLIEHDCRFLYKKNKRWKHALQKCVMCVDQYIFIGNLTAQSFADNGIILPCKQMTESAFLPPHVIEEQNILRSYPQDIFLFLQRHKRVILANAFALALIDGKDLYGFDLCVQALHSMRSRGLDVGFVLVLAQIGDIAYYKKLLVCIEQLKLSHAIYIMSGQRVLWPLIKKVDLFVRPTLSDGASVSIEEALWLQKPVVASDVCMRPKGVHLFASGDSNALALAIEPLLLQV